MQEARLGTEVFLWIGYIRVLEEMSTNNPWIFPLTLLWQNTTVYTECLGYVFGF